MVWKDGLDQSKSCYGDALRDKQLSQLPLKLQKAPINYRIELVIFNFGYLHPDNQLMIPTRSVFDNAVARQFRRHAEDGVEQDRESIGLAQSSDILLETKVLNRSRVEPYMSLSQLSRSIVWIPDVDKTKSRLRYLTPIPSASGYVGSAMVCPTAP